MTATIALTPRLALPPRLAPFPGSPPRAGRPGRYELEHVSDAALHAEVKTLTGRYNGLTAELLTHLAEVDARGTYRERACSSLYTYCVYELRLSEDEAQRRARAARTARAFPVLFEMVAEGAIHLTGLLLLAPYLTAENHAELLTRARFRTKRELEHLVAEIAPRPDIPARIEPLGPRPAAARSTWQAYTASLRGPVRELVPGLGAGDAPPDVGVDSCEGAGDAVATKLDAPARVKGRRGRPGGGAGRRDGGETDGLHGRHVPAEIRRAVWKRDAGCCTFVDPNGRRCCERAGLELHHEHAFALGGPTTLENLRLMCRAHNALFAERDFGRAHVERMKSARRDGPVAG